MKGETIKGKHIKGITSIRKNQGGNRKGEISMGKTGKRANRLGKTSKKENKTGKGKPVKGEISREETQ